MNLQHRIDLLDRLGAYILSNEKQWKDVCERAGQENGWFTPEFVEHAARTIATTFLQRDILEQWVAPYHADKKTDPKNIGVVMAGNIPLAGFHDWMTIFISGN